MDTPSASRTAEIWQQLFDSAASPAEFWPHVLEAAVAIAPALCASLYVRDSNQTEVRWRPLGRKPTNRSLGLPEAEVTTLCNAALQNGMTLGEKSVGAIALQTATEEKAAVIVATAPGSVSDLDAWLENLALLRPLPTLLRLHVRSTRAEGDVRRIAAVLDLMLLLNRETRFLAAAICVCNELASRHQYLRVAIGWLENEEIHLKAISHSEKFERKMEMVQHLEQAMEECLDQDIEVVWPDDQHATTLTREHAAFAKLSQSGTIITVPLRAGSEVCGVMSFERKEATSSTSDELDQLRLYADQAGRRLDDLHDRDRWWGARLWSSLRESVTHLLGPRHTGWKMAGCTAAILLLILVFGHKTYWVEAPFSLQSDAAIYITAPFEGFLSEAPAEVGDTVNTGDPLAIFDDRELRLQEADTLAELGRHQREAEKARADSDYASMRISQARAQQLEAKRDLLRQRIEQAVVRAPRRGIVIEGDLRERLGAPLDKGELLFLINGLEGLRIEAEVDERDISEIAEGRRVKITFASRPDQSFDAILERIDPVATPAEKSNVFGIRCKLEGDTPDWWRPGMSGVAKVAGQRHSLLWILTHRTVDFIRMKVWI